MKHPRPGIAAKITAAFVLISAALVIGVGLPTYLGGRSALESATLVQMASLAGEKEAALNAWVEERKDDLASMAASASLLQNTAALVGATAQDAHDQIVAELQVRVSLDSTYPELMILDPETGEVLAATDPSEEGKFKENRAFFLDGRNGPSLEGAFYSISAQGPAMAASAPMRSSDGRLLGVLAANLNLDDVNAIVKRRGDQRTSDDAFLVNTSNMFVTQPRLTPDPAVLQLGIRAEAVTLVLAGKSGTTSALDYRGVPALIAYRWLPALQAGLIVKIDQSEAFAPLRVQRNTVILAGLFALLAAAALAYWLARTVSVPICKLVKGAAEIGSGKLDTRIAIRSKDETGQLAAAFAQMAESLQTTLVSRDQLAGEVAERTRAEDHLREANEYLDNLFNYANAPIIVWDPEFRITRFNHAFEALTGRKAQEVVGGSIEILFPVGHEAASMEYIRKTQVGVRWETVEIPILHRNGSVRTVLWNSATIFDTDHVTPVATIAQGQDITERKQAEERLLFISKAVEATSDAIGISDAQGRHVYQNKALSDLFEYADAEEMEAAGGGVAAVKDPEVAKAMYGNIKSGRSWTGELEMVTKSGRVFPAYERADAVTDSEGNLVGLIGIIRDITERKQAEEALRLTEEQLRQSQKMEAVGQLAGGIAHDFNNLLTAIIGYSELTLASLEGHSESLRPDMEEIKHAADRASALTGQILAFSRRQALRPSVVSLNDVLNGMEPMLHRTLGENIDLVSLQQPGLGCAEIDVHQFEQVLMNLALNARDAMPSGGRLTIETANVELDEEYCRAHPDATPGDCVMLAVSDTGIGMDEATLGHIFEPFFTTKPQGAGTGLGLATVYGIVKQSRGDISVYSEPGKGTTFKIYLPAVTAHDAAAEIVLAEHISGLGHERVVVVEDESSLRSLIERVLGGAGYQVVCFGSADDAMVALQQGQVTMDLLLTDVVLPGAMQGNDLARSVQNSQPGMPVLFMSGYTRNAIVHAGRLDDGINFLEKPFTPEALVRMVREVLDQAASAAK